MNKNLLPLCTLSALLLSPLAFATPPGSEVTSFNDHNETRLYVGVQWFLEQTPLTRPDLVLALRKTTTDVAEHIHGAEVSYSYSLAQMHSDAVRVGYLNGKCDVLGTLGVGYSLIDHTGLLYAGAVGPYSGLVGQINGNKQLELGLELNSQSCPGGPDQVSHTVQNLG
jgi:hypothetical protein